MPECSKNVDACAVCSGDASELASANASELVLHEPATTLPLAPFAAFVPLNVHYRATITDTSSGVTLEFNRAALLSGLLISRKGVSLCLPGPLTSAPVARGPRGPYEMSDDPREASGFRFGMLVWYKFPRTHQLLPYIMGHGYALYFNLQDAIADQNRVQRPALNTLRNQNRHLLPPTLHQLQTAHVYQALAFQLA